jgi:hypothetical protein
LLSSQSGTGCDESCDHGRNDNEFRFSIQLIELLILIADCISNKKKFYIGVKYIYDNFEFSVNFNERDLFRMWVHAIKDRHRSTCIIRAVCCGSHVTCGLYFILPSFRSIIFHLSKYNCKSTVQYTIFAAFHMQSAEGIPTYRPFFLFRVLSNFLLRAGFQKVLLESCQISNALLFHRTPRKNKYTVLYSKRRLKNYLLLTIIVDFLLFDIYSAFDYAFHILTAIEMLVKELILK